MSSLVSVASVSPLKTPIIPYLSYRSRVSLVAGTAALAVGAAGLLAVGAMSATQSTTAARASVSSRDIAGSMPEVTASAGIAGLLGLPQSLQFAANPDLGAGDNAFYVKSDSGGMSTSSPTYGFDTRFTPAGPVLSEGSESLSLALSGVGRGNVLANVAAITPSVGNAPNVVEYARGGGIMERYDHGPLGVQQTITLSNRPVGGAGDVTVSMRVGGGLTPTVSADRDSVSFSDGLRAVGGYRNLTVTDSAGAELPAHLSAMGENLAISINDRNARYPLTVDPMVWLDGVTAPQGNGYGYAVASVVSDHINNWNDDNGRRTYVAIGAPYSDEGSTVNTGRVYAYRTDSNGPMLAESSSFAPSGLAANSLFGASVDITEGNVPFYGGVPDYWTWIAVGAPGATASFIYRANQSVMGSSVDFGKVTGLLPAAGLPAENSGFGKSITVNFINGNVIAGVGAPLNEFAFYGDAGIATVYKLGGNVSETADLQPETILVNSLLAGGDQFGAALDLAPNGTLAVGVPYEDGGQADQGAVAIFTEPSGGWENAASLLSPTAKLAAPDPAAQDLFGYSVKLNTAADILVVGVPQDDWSNRVNAGSARVFQKASGGWGSTVQSAWLHESTGANGDLFGYSVGINGQGNYITVGAPAAEVANVSAQGLVFAFSGSPWGGEKTQVQTITSNTPAWDGNFGRSVDTVHMNLVVGSTDLAQPGGDAGKAEFYHYQ